MSILCTLLLVIIFIFIISSDHTYLNHLLMKNRLLSDTFPSHTQNRTGAHTHSLPTHSLTPSVAHTLAPALARPPTDLHAHSPTHAVTHSLTGGAPDVAPRGPPAVHRSLPTLLTHLLTHSLTHSYTHSPSHPLAHRWRT